MLSINQEGSLSQGKLSSFEWWHRILSFLVQDFSNCGSQTTWWVATLCPVGPALGCPTCPCIWLAPNCSLPDQSKVSRCKWRPHQVSTGLQKQPKGHFQFNARFVKVKGGFRWLPEAQCKRRRWVSMPSTAEQVSHSKEGMRAS